MLDIMEVHIERVLPELVRDHIHGDGLLTSPGAVGGGPGVVPQVRLRGHRLPAAPVLRRGQQSQVRDRVHLVRMVTLLGHI